jgi:hypothetical protein
MMSASYCIQKAEMCESRAVECANAIHEADWLKTAAHWRALAEDENVQATTARLMAIGS